MNLPPVDPRTKRFFGRSEGYGPDSFADEWRVPTLHIAISGPPGSGTSTLKKHLYNALKAEGYQCVSGGDLQRHKATALGITVNELAKRNRANPKTGTDRATEEFLIDTAFEYMESGLILDARLAHAVMSFVGIPLLVELDADEYVRAERNLPKYREELEDDTLSVGDSARFNMERNNDDIGRFNPVYPGYIFPAKHIHCRLDTSEMDEESVWKSVLAHYRRRNGIVFVEPSRLPMGRVLVPVRP